MDSVQKTLYIPLYGKAFVSQKGLILHDPTAEAIWKKEGFPLKGKAKSKYLAYYMAMRTAVFDAWLEEKLAAFPGAMVMHPGCGLDSRIKRVKHHGVSWYDVDFPAVMKEREKYFFQTDFDRMVAGDLRKEDWLKEIPKHDHALITLEGVSMYLTEDEVKRLIEQLCGHFNRISLLMDIYTPLAARFSKYKNPVHGLGVSQVYGLEHPSSLETKNFSFVKEHSMTPAACISLLQGAEKILFQKLYAGSFSQKLYRLWEFEKL